MFHPGWRERALSVLGQPFDAVIVGGGITGCGILFDAAQRGLAVLLVEKGDLAAGTSSRTTKLVHGGLRYLKQMQFGITVAASRERERMLALDRGLVRPMEFVYPAHRGDRLPAWTVDLGLWMYDHLARRRDRHDHLELAEVEARLPGLATDDLEAAFSYNDAVTDDAQLTRAVAATGFAYGGFLLTRAEATELLRDRTGRIAGVLLSDLETGASHRVAAGVVINATGVWSDMLRTAAGLDDARLRPSRGVHLELPGERLPVACAAMVPAADGRPVFVVPHEEGVLVGTTDVYHDGPLDDPRPSRAEVDYLLQALQAHFPDRGLGRGDVRGAFAGLRPILDAHVEDPSEASREEAIWEEDGMLSVAGGKLTTWRRTAERAVDALVEMLPVERREAAEPCRTEGTPLVGLAPADLPERLAARGVPPPVATGLARRLRADAWWALQLARQPAELQPLLDGGDLSAAEVRAHLALGGVLRLEDVLLRRVRLAMWDPDQARAVVPLLQQLFVDELGWNERRWERECDAYEQAAVGWSAAGIER